MWKIVLILIMASEEEDDYTRENEAGERLVGRGLRGRDVNPQDPQWYLANSGQPDHSGFREDVVDFD